MPTKKAVMRSSNNISSNNISSNNIVSLQEEEEEVEKDGDRSPGSDDCHIIPNDKSTEFILATVVEDSA
jgi:hypothetical protein